MTRKRSSSSRARRRPRIAISAGDPSGVGPEILAAALTHPRVRRALEPLVFGDASLAELLGLPVLGSLPRGSAQRRSTEVPSLPLDFDGPGLVAVSRLPAAARRAGRPSERGGAAQLAYFEAALEACVRGEADGLCTAPVSKEQIAASGAPGFTGHTEHLGARLRCRTLMLMAGPKLSVALATTHLPLRKVPQAITRGLLRFQLRLLDESLTTPNGRPRIAVLGLNPHAGEGGLLGDEERKVIGPAVEEARAAGMLVEGPLPADGALASYASGAFDVYLAMFHDQGLAATKTLDFHRTVNVTLGLPFPRTSPDHGVAYSLAGKGEASATPMVSALIEAARLVRARRG